MKKERINELKEEVMKILKNVKEKIKKVDKPKIKFAHISELRERCLPNYIYCHECGWIYLSNEPLKGMEFVVMDRGKIIGSFCSAECLGKGLKKLGKATVYTAKEFYKYFINYFLDYVENNYVKKHKKEV